MKDRRKTNGKSERARKNEATVERLRFDVLALARHFRSERFPEGFNSGYALSELCNISSPTVASRTLQGNMTQIGDITIERICAGFNCSPADFIITRPDLMPAEGRALRRARNALGLSPEEFAAAFSERVGFLFDAEAVIAWEKGKAKVRDGIWQAIAIALIEAWFPPTGKPKNKPS